MEGTSSDKFADQDYESLRQSSISSGKLFVDPKFPPSTSSLYVDRDGEDLEWKRPSEIVDDPDFLGDGYTRFDVMQGSIH